MGGEATWPAIGRGSELGLTTRGSEPLLLQKSVWEEQLGTAWGSKSLSASISRFVVHGK